MIGLTRFRAPVLPQGVQRLEANLCAPETLPRTLDRVEGVCHLAGLTKARESRSAPLDYRRTNLGGTLAILTALTNARARRLVLASTCMVYSTHAGQLVSGNAAVAPSNPYGTSKLAADLP